MPSAKPDKKCSYVVTLEALLKAGRTNMLCDDAVVRWGPKTKTKVA